MLNLIPSMWPCISHFDLYNFLMFKRRYNFFSMWMTNKGQNERRKNKIKNKKGEFRHQKKIVSLFKALAIVVYLVEVELSYEHWPQITFAWSINISLFNDSLTSLFASILLSLFHVQYFLFWLNTFAVNPEFCQFYSVCFISFMVA